MVHRVVALLVHGVAAEWLGTGRQFSFFVDSGSVWAAGRNHFGQLGIDDDDSDVDERERVKIPEGINVTQIAAGAFHSLFLTSEGTVFAAGRNRYGELGVGAVGQDQRSPVMVNFSAKVKSVAAGYAHSLFLLEDESVYASGLNSHGQLGDNTTDAQQEPVYIIGGVHEIAAGYDFSYFRKAGQVLATGNNLGGQLGLPISYIYKLPETVMEVTNVAAMTAGSSHGLFLTEDGTVYSTGANFAGQLGLDDTNPRKLPELTTLQGVEKVFAGGDSSCVITNEHTLFGMGSNRDGQMGLNSNEVFIDRQELKTDMLSVAIGDSHVLALHLSGVVWAAGSNSHGEFGDGSKDDSKEWEEIDLTLDVPDWVPTTEAPSREPQAPTPKPPGSGIDTVILWGAVTAAGLLALGLGVCLQRRASSDQEDPDDDENQNRELVQMRAGMSS